MPDSRKPLKIDDPRLVAALRDVFEERVPFNKALAMKIVSMDPAAPVIRIDMRSDLVGNFMRGILHGGVISAVLDVACGLGAMLSVIEKHIAHGEPLEAQIGRFSRIGTIDLRVDYLRPGVGEWFVAKAEIMRSGNRVAVVRSELRNDSDELIAAAVAAYTIG
ncbi:MAG: thioesterase family protein [Sterolibacterium sp.]|jgi:uncharacterized protein (TIGR00369 family)